MVSFHLYLFPLVSSRTGWKTHTMNRELTLNIVTCGKKTKKAAFHILTLFQVVIQLTFIQDSIYVTLFWNEMISVVSSSNQLIPGVGWWNRIISTVAFACYHNKQFHCGQSLVWKTLGNWWLMYSPSKRRLPAWGA